MLLTASGEASWRSVLSLSSQTKSVVFLLPPSPDTLYIFQSLLRSICSQPLSQNIHLATASHSSTSSETREIPERSAWLICFLSCSPIGSQNTWVERTRKDGHDHSLPFALLSQTHTLALSLRIFPPVSWQSEESNFVFDILEPIPCGISGHRLHGLIFSARPCMHYITKKPPSSSFAGRRFPPHRKQWGNQRHFSCS